jgi:cysteine-S-conjugate beta-lyase
MASPTSTPNFTLPRDLLHSRQGAKWNRHGKDVIPAWVADMDFLPAPAIQQAIEHLTKVQDYGYPQRAGDRAEFAVSRAFAARMKNRFGWSPDPALIQPVADLVQGTYSSILAFSDPGDGVILQIPSYPPFRESILDTGRRLISHQVRYDGERIDMNIDALEKLVDDRTKIILLCSPHNPTGHVYRRAELEAIADIAIRHDLIVLSDEIHCDLVYPGNTHIPFASLGPEIAARTVTLNSATKSFNIPGLRCALLHFGSAALRDRFHTRVPKRVLGSPGIFGIDATVAAWEGGQPWLDAVVAHLLTARDHIADVIAKELPMLRFYKPEATYLSWIDCSGLQLPTTAFKFFHEKAKIGFSAGETFDPLCPNFVRFNFGTSIEIIDEILGRMIAAARHK